MIVEGKGEGEEEEEGRNNNSIQHWLPNTITCVKRTYSKNPKTYCVLYKNKK